MTVPLDTVRDILANPEEVDLPEDMARNAGESDSPGSFDDGWDGVDPGGPPHPPMGDAEAAEPPEARCARFPLNDFGNGRRLIEHFGEDLLFVPRVGWFVWSGKHWRQDPDGIEVRRKAHLLGGLIAREVWHLQMSREDAEAVEKGRTASEVVEAISAIPARSRTDAQVAELARAQKVQAAAEAIAARRDKASERRLTHAKNAGNSNAIKNLMAEASAVIAREVEDLDASPLLVNTATGVLRFWTEPGADDGGAQAPPPVARVELLAHAREQLLTKLMPVAYDPPARCPRFTAFLERVLPAAEVRRFLQRWFGLSMTGLTHEQKFVFLHGGGANGKSVLVDVIAQVLGDYAASAKIESLTGKNRRGGGDATPDLMPLIGARFVRTSEPDEGQRLQEGLIKELTGGEPILIRALNENFVKVYPIFKLTISGNHKPEIHGGDDGIWRRVLLVPFDVQIPPDERDPDLKEKLLEEAPGILNWLIGGLLDYLHGGLQIPDTVSAATREYREDSDPVGTFLTDCCEVTGAAEDVIPAKELSTAFNTWLDDSGRGTWTPQTVFKRLAGKAESWKSPASGMTFRAHKSRGTRLYVGLRLKPDFRARMSDAENRDVPEGGYYDL